MLQVRTRRVWPWVAVVIVLLVTTYLLRSQGRLWWCSCGRLLLWSGDAWSSDNSQHLFDPYSFTHILHGFLFCGLLAWGVPRLPPVWRLCLAVSAEALWEVVENSDFVIRRYREATAALGYQGDTIVNSLGDILTCGLGFVIARHLGYRRSLALFVATEVLLLIWIRDSLILNVVMLLYPIDAIKAWQANH
ncbi:MAG: DUF2585 family protein [Pyrinomonadaceae bacterium]|nr:DUF2585 family protein [Pyrinomonadaceae bacterium]